MTSTVLAARDQDAFALGKVFKDSGMFPTVKKEAEAVVKIGRHGEPNLGDISRRNREGLRGGGKIIWAECPDCLCERWVPLALPDQRCRTCGGHEHERSGHLARLRAMPKRAKDQHREKNHGWKGGRRQAPGGYVYVLIADDDPMRCMAGKDGYVFEHRLVMARAIERPLRWAGPGQPDSETVHHINGDRQDNRLENLELWMGYHGTGIRASDAHCPGCRCGETT